MRRDDPSVFELQVGDALPAEPALVIEALEPLLTDERRLRIDSVIARRTRSVIPVMDGLIDPHNVAAVLRSADAFGVQEVHLIRGPEAFLVSTRVAQGTERWVDIVTHDTARACIETLHGRGYRVYVATMDGQAQPGDLQGEDKVAVVFGNEHAGVSAEIRALVDGTYAVGMRGFVESLNVSVATAITLHDATRDRAGDLSESEQLLLRARFMMYSVQRADAVVREHLRRRQR